MKGHPFDYERFVSEVAWLRSFNKNDEAVARALQMSLNTFHKQCSRARASGLVVPA